MLIHNPENGSVDAEASQSTAWSASFLPASSDRYILTHVGTQQLAFPSQWVAEILLVDRSQILVLPFYDPMLLGVVHHHGQIIPLVAVWQALGAAPAPTRETLSVVQLSEAADRLAGVGIVVDRASDNRLREQFPDALFNPNAVMNAGKSPSGSGEPPVQLFHPGLVNDRLWSPQRWQPTNLDRSGSA